MIGGACPMCTRAVFSREEFMRLRVALGNVLAILLTAGSALAVEEKASPQLVEQALASLPVKYDKVQDRYDFKLEQRAVRLLRFQDGARLLLKTGTKQPAT